MSRRFWAPDEEVREPIPGNPSAVSTRWRRGRSAPPVLEGSSAAVPGAAEGCANTERPRPGPRPPSRTGWHRAYDYPFGQVWLNTAMFSH
jgi:hypothetical protein